MNRPLRRLLLPVALALVAAFSPAVFAQDDSSFDDERRAIIEENRRIWERLTPEHREKLTQRFRELKEIWKDLTPEEREAERARARQLFQKLDTEDRYRLATPEGREEVRRRFARFRHLTEAILSGLERNVSAQVEALSPEQQRHVRRFLWVVYLESRERMLLERQPPRARRAYEALRPNDQREKLREWSAQWRDEILADLGEEERAALDAAGKKELVDKVMAEERFTQTTHVVGERLPELLAMSAEDRVAAIHEEWMRLGAERYRDRFKRRFLDRLEDPEKRRLIDELPVEAQDSAIAEAIWRDVRAELREQGHDEEAIKKVIENETWQEMADAYFKAVWGKHAGWPGGRGPRKPGPVKKK